MSTAKPHDTLKIYEAAAEVYARQRAVTLFERPMLDALVRLAPGPDTLDLGCGPGLPLAHWLARRGQRLTGVDGAHTMLRQYRRNVPGSRTRLQDMRHLALGCRFDAVLAWDSFFHLDLPAQARMFPVFARHTRPGAVLAFSSGPRRGVAFGHVAGVPIYHASHDPLTYRRLLRASGFETIRFHPEDPALDFHSWWVCRKAR